MTNLFVTIFNISVTAGWMILAVLFIRFLCRKMPKTWHCFLWYLVMLRLLLPVSIESEWSLIPNSKVITEDLLYSQNPVSEVENINITEQILSSDGPMTDEEKQAKFEAHLARVEAEDELTQSQTDTERAAPSLLVEFIDFITPNAGDSVNPLQVIVYGASYIWLFGMAVMLVYTCISCRRVTKRIKEAVLLRDNIYQSEQVESPFVFGMMKPRIYVPFSLTVESLDCVIAHERTHIKRFDHIMRLLAFLLLAIYWFQPLVWVFYLLLCRDMELACDEMVLKQIGMDKKKLYSKILLECSVSNKKITVCPLAFGETGVKQRIKNILNFRKPAAWLVVGTILLCMVLVVCFMTNPVNDGYGTGSTQTEYEGGQSDEEIIATIQMTNDISDEAGDNPDAANEMGGLTEQQIAALTEPKNLTEPPALYLTDPLSSLYSEFAVQPGSYEWSYQTEEGVTGISACGLHPIEAAKEAERLTIPDYNGMDDVIYTFGYSVMPDRLEIKEYSIWDMGDVDAEPLEEKTVDGDYFVHLKQNRIYDIYAVWEESKFEERGFYGNASYTVVSGDKAPVADILATITQNEPQTPKIDFSEQEPYTEEVNTLDGVTMYMKKFKSPEGDVEIRNESGKQLQYGDWYDIQVQQDDAWYSLPMIIDNAAYEAIAYPVEDQSTSVWQINWSYFYGELPAGKYRIVKDIMDWRAPGDYTKYYLAAEFEIK